ncbi:MAG: ABC transporter permease [Desulfobacteraceae bacterium]|nr:MAG: ABC transporter permease [Desulfobacteraceae bacterium]
MFTYIVRRVLQLIPVLFGVSIFVFVGMHAIPGDVATLLLGDKGTPESLARLRHELSLDQPIYVQYVRFATEALKGNFGVSLRTRQPAFTEVWRALPMTAELSLCAITFAILVGVPVGTLAAVRQYSLFDSVSMIGVLVGVSMPIFWTALILMMIFGGRLHWLPIGGILDEGLSLKRITGIHLVDSLLQGDLRAFASAARHLVLPTIALGSIAMATIARMTRASVLEVMGQDYVRTARAKGLRESLVVYRHAFRNSLIPVVTVIGLQLSVLLSGAVLTETVFALPGLGRLAITSILARDYAVVQAVVMVTALAIVVINLVVDLLYACLDPRIRYT